MRGKPHHVNKVFLNNTHSCKMPSSFCSFRFFFKKLLFLFIVTPFDENNFAYRENLRFSSAVTGLNSAGLSEYGLRQAGHSPFSLVRIRCQQKRQTWNKSRGEKTNLIAAGTREKVLIVHIHLLHAEGALNYKRNAQQALNTSSFSSICWCCISANIPQK
jgi:hypothetical protein